MLFILYIYLVGLALGLLSLPAYSAYFTASRYIDTDNCVRLRRNATQLQIEESKKARAASKEVALKYHDYTSRDLIDTPTIWNTDGLKDSAGITHGDDRIGGLFLLFLFFWPCWVVYQYGVVQAYRLLALPGKLIANKVNGIDTNPPDDFELKGHQEVEKLLSDK